MRGLVSEICVTRILLYSVVLPRNNFYAMFYNIKKKLTGINMSIQWTDKWLSELISSLYWPRKNAFLIKCIFYFNNINEDAKCNHVYNNIILNRFNRYLFVLTMIYNTFLFLHDQIIDLYTFLKIKSIFTVLYIILL